MSLSMIARTAGTLILAVGLSGCIDATMELEVLSETNGRGIMTVVMDKEIYNMSQQAGGDSDFCDDGTIEVTETQAICTDIEEGSFDELSFNEDDPDADEVSITSVGPGLVRVGFPTQSMSSDFGGEEVNDPQTKQMMQAFLVDHYLTLRISGGQIVETNMEIAADGQSAELVIPLLDLINGSASVPAEAFAVVQK